MKNGKQTWGRIRRVWATLGILALLGFAGWSFVAYRASSDAQMTFISDARVSVTRGEDCWLLAPAATSSLNVGLVFFPGALVEPAAYGPLLRKVALSGYPVLLIELPRRGAFGGADGGEVMGRAQRAMQAVTSVSAWVVAGHSRGGVVAARFVREGRSEGIRGLVLVGTSHPRDFSLAEVTLPVTKILGTRDGVAPIAKSEKNRHLLPKATRWVLIEGGNHSQFGSYGFQPFDRFATVDRDRQQELTRDAIVDTLQSVALGDVPANNALQSPAEPVD